MTRYTGDRQGHCRTCRTRVRLVRCPSCRGRGRTLTTQCPPCRDSGYACEQGAGNRHHPWS